MGGERNINLLYLARNPGSSLHTQFSLLCEQFDGFQEGEVNIPLFLSFKMHLLQC